MCRTSTHTEMGSYAVHKVGNEWEVIAPSDDPTTPAYWRVGVIRERPFGYRALPPSSAVVEPTNHAARPRIWSQSPRKKDRIAR